MRAKGRATSRKVESGARLPVLKPELEGERHLVALFPIWWQIGCCPAAQTGLGSDQFEAIFDLLLILARRVG